MARWNLAAALLAAAVFTVPAKAAEKAAPELRAKRAAGKIDVDGRLDDAGWKGAAEVRLRAADGKADARAPTTVKVAWDEKYLYLAFVCRDPDIGTDHRGRDSHMWTEDVVECFIDPDLGDPNYVELEVNPYGDLFDGMFFVHRADVLMSWNPEIRVAAAVDGTVNRPDDEDRSWTVEMAIPAADLAIAPGVGKPGAAIRPGTRWAINFYRGEKSRGSTEPQAWAPVRGDFHAVELYGRILFE